MRKLAYFFFLFYLNYFTVTAQSSFAPARLYLFNGDSLSGLINYASTKPDPLPILFRKDSISPITIYTPLQVKSFYVGSEYYVSKIVTSDRSPYYTSDWQEPNKMVYSTDTIFANVQIIGPVSFYSWIDKDNKERFYIEKAGMPILQLTNHAVKTIEHNHESITENHRYKNELRLYLSDCENISDRIMNVKYNAQSIQDIIEEYNLCKGVKNTYSKKSYKKVNASVAAGYVITKFEMETYASPYTDYRKLIFGSSKNLTFGGGISIYLSQTNTKWSIYNELLLRKYVVGASFYNYYNNETDYKLTVVTLGGSYFKLNNILRYQFTIKTSPIEYFTGIGIFNAFAISTYNNISTQRVFKSYNDKQFYENALSDYSKYESGAIACIGMRYKMIGLDFRYEIGDGTVSHSKTKSAYLLLSYQF